MGSNFLGETVTFSEHVVAIVWFGQFASRYFPGYAQCFKFGYTCIDLKKYTFWFRRFRKPSFEVAKSCFCLKFYVMQSAYVDFQNLPSDSLSLGVSYVVRGAQKRMVLTDQAIIYPRKRSTILTIRDLAYSNCFKLYNNMMAYIQTCCYIVVKCRVLVPQNILFVYLENKPYRMKLCRAVQSVVVLIRSTSLSDGSCMTMTKKAVTLSEPRWAINGGFLEHGALASFYTSA